MITQDQIQINTLALNSMKLDELIQVDRANGSDDASVLRESGETSVKSTGLGVPFISINGYNVTKYLLRFHLDLSGFMPTVRFTFIAAESMFISVNYPKDGDIVSIYMRSPGDFYKPFRMDFNVLSVISETTNKRAKDGIDSEGLGINLKFTIEGECRIPGLYTERIKSFPNINSSDCLLEISQELNLGFSTNEKQTDDKMTWLCPSYSYFDLIKEVTSRAYKDDDTSFFDCWIDSYYNLNFVNLGNQFSYGAIPKVDATFIPGSAPGGLKPASAIPGTPDPEPVQMPLILTNLTGFGTIPYFIIGYTLTSRSGNLTNAKGYVTDFGFYDESKATDNPTEKYVHYDIESQTPEDIQTGMILQKGRARENIYKEERRIDWYGVLNIRSSNTSGGVHKNFLHAQAQNEINLMDSYKMTLEVELGTYFPGIYRGQVIPVQIFLTNNGLRQQNAGPMGNGQANTTSQPTLDVFLSGNYVVIGMHVTWNYNSAGMKQRLILAKRQWTANSSGLIPKAFPISLTKGIL